MSKLNKLHFVEFWCWANYRPFFHGALFINWSFIKKKHCSKPLFSHGRCQYDQDYAFYEGMGDDNRNFSDISIFGEELERKFRKLPIFLPCLKFELKTLLSLENPIGT